MAFPDDARDIKASFAFGHSDAEDPTGLTYEQVSPDPDDEGDPGPVLDTLRLTRGRDGDSPTTAPTSVQMRLRNTDGRFSKRNVTGPYHGRLRNGTPVEIAVDVGSGDVVVARAGADFEAPRWRGPDIDDTVTIIALGALARLGRDRNAFSVLERYYAVSSPSPTSYWSLTGNRSAEVGALTSGAGGPFESVFWGTAKAEPGTSELAPWLGTGLRLKSDGVSVLASLDLSPSLTRVTVETTFVFSPEPGEICAGFLAIAEEKLEGGFPLDGQVWAIVARQLSDDSLSVRLFALQDGVSLMDEAITAPTIVAPGPHHMRFDLEQDGGDIDWTVYLDGESIGSDTVSSAILPQFTNTQFIYTATAGEITFGHAAIYHNITPPDIADVWDAVRGYAGEQAHERIERTAAEAGVTVVITGSQSTAMGPQYPDTLLGIWRDCESTDHGILYEARDGRVAYKTLSTLYDLTPAMTLDYGDEIEPGDIADLVPIDDVRDVHNVVTVTRRTSGARATAEQETGPVGTDEIGERPLPVTLNLAEDDQIADHAGWLLWTDTIDQPRYIVVLDLLARPDLAAAWLAADIGSRIAIVGAPPKHVGPDDLELIVEAERIEIGSDRWLVELYCEPYAPYAVGALSDDPPDDVLGWLDWDVCQLAAGLLLPGAGTDYADTPDTADLRVTGDFAVAAEFFGDWTPSAAGHLVAKDDPDTGDRAYRLRLNANGTVSLLWSPDGSATLSLTSSVAVEPSALGGAAVKATLDVDDGAGGHSVTFEVADSIDGDFEPLGTVQTGAGTTSVFAGEADLRVGVRGDGSQPLAGLVTAVRVWDAGVLVADARFDQQPTGTTTFEDDAGLTWTVQGSASIVGPPDVDDTTWYVAADPLDSTDSDDFPRPVLCEGELVTVTACSGSSVPQTWTVTRSVNGVSKAHLAKATIALAQPIILAL